MHTVSKCLCLASASLLLTACATVGDPPISKQSTELKYDSDYMASVEYASDRAGVEVLWVNPPRNKDRKED